MRVRAKSLNKIKRLTVTLNGKRVARGRHSMLRFSLPVSKLKHGKNKLAMITKSKAGTTKRTIRFKAC